MQEGGRYKPQSVNLRIKGSYFTGLHPRSLVISSPLENHPLTGPVFTSWSKRTFIHDLEESERGVSSREDQRSAAEEGAGQWIRKQILQVHPGQPTKPESLGERSPLAVPRIPGALPTLNLRTTVLQEMSFKGQKARAPQQVTSGTVNVREL